MLHHGSVGASSEQNKRNLTLTLTVPSPSIVFQNKIFVFIMSFTALSFLRLTHGLFLYEEVMLVRLYDNSPGENCPQEHCPKDKLHAIHFFPKNQKL